MATLEGATRGVARAQPFEFLRINKQRPYEAAVSVERERAGIKPSLLFHGEVN